MATDRDRYAQTLDKRFNKIAFRIRTATPDAVDELCKYVVHREREAEPRLPELFREAHLLRTRREVPLFPDKDPSLALMEQRGRESSPARRLAEAFVDAQTTGDEIAIAYAKREARWVEACLATQSDWPDARLPFALLKSQLVQKLAEHHRTIYLRMEPAQRTHKDKSDQSDLVRIEFPANP